MQFSEIDYIKLLDAGSGYAWPLLAGLLIFCFRNEIRELLRRMIKISARGAEFGMAVNQQSAPATTSVEFDTLQDVGLPRTTAIETVEKRIYRELTPIENDKKISYLARNLAQVLLERKFERIYTFIFGSQIEGLRELRRAGGSISLHSAELYFSQIKPRYGTFYDTSSFADWFSYVLRNELASKSDQLIMITPLGIDFVDYLDVQQLPTRPF